jgi:hypothetical protein
VHRHGRCSICGLSEAGSRGEHRRAQQQQMAQTTRQLAPATHGRTFAPEKSRTRWLAKFTTPLERFNRYAEGGFPPYRSTVLRTPHSNGARPISSAHSAWSPGDCGLLSGRRWRVLEAHSSTGSRVPACTIMSHDQQGRQLLDHAIGKRCVAACHFPGSRARYLQPGFSCNHAARPWSPWSASGNPSTSGF